MIQSSNLLRDLQGRLKPLIADLTHRVHHDESIHTRVSAQYQAAFDAQRTGWTFTAWADDLVNQVAVGWLLACVFVRFGEDNGLIDDARVAGVADRGEEARLAQRDFFGANPHASDRDYLHDTFTSAASLPGLDGVLGEKHSPLWQVDPSADACTDLLDWFRKVDDDGSLVADFTDPALDTRFLGDLYQDLSEHAKKTYALLQTPVFVEEFILDRTLTPSIETTGLADTKLIDPTCGSGHFLLGAFDRLADAWAEAMPADDVRQVSQRALDAVWGVDVNPFAAAIARFRLLVAALQRCGIHRLVDAPDFQVNVAVGDSLLWGAAKQSLPGFEEVGLVDRSEGNDGAAAPEGLPGFDDAGRNLDSSGDDGGVAGQPFVYATEDAAALARTFNQRYAAVVGNPPYITPKDKALNAQYRDLYKEVCHRSYSLGVPFTQLFVELAAKANSRKGRSAGHVGMITANSFMKREFGKKLIEDFMPKWDLTAVIDTSGAYIPGHGTPTVILFGRNQRPVAEAVRTVMGIRGEPSTPDDPATGLVWSAIVEQMDRVGSESEYVSVSDVARARFSAHPWSLTGGGAAELGDLLSANRAPLANVVVSIGYTGQTNGDDVMVATSARDFARRGVEHAVVRQVVVGEVTRDWSFGQMPQILFPYTSSHLLPIEEVSGFLRWVWPARTMLGNRATFAKLTYFDEGRPWWEWHQVALHRLKTPLSISYGEVATHNHFVLDRGGKVFNRTAPAVKLDEDATEHDYLGLLALLNSSVACFWMQQTFHNKGGPGGGSSKDEKWRDFYQLDGTKLKLFPLAKGDRPIEPGRQLDDLAQQLTACQPSAVAHSAPPTRDRLADAHAQADRLLAEMVSAQEELDWHCLQLYGLTDQPLTVTDGAAAPPLALGERAFEIVMARKVKAGSLTTRWFADFGGVPITEPPDNWPGWYRDLVNQRIALIESNRNIGLVERPENKRRWNREPWDKLQTEALRDWLLDRLEAPELWFEGGAAKVRTLGQLADRMAVDETWMEVARLWAGAVDIDPLAIVAELVADQHVPAQAAARYKPAGLAKRAEWERTWDLQRAEDRGEDVGRIAVPPKYGSGDFLKTSYWRQRGKLDVPKERFASVAGADRDGGNDKASLVLAWAGFDDAQMAQALATLIVQRQTADGWSDERLIPLIAALHEVVPWVEQWHPDVDPAMGQTLGAFYRGQVDQALAMLGLTRDALLF